MEKQDLGSFTCKMIWPTTRRDPHRFSNTVIGCDWLRVGWGWKSIKQWCAYRRIFHASHSAFVYHAGPAYPPVPQAILDVAVYKSFRDLKIT